MVSIEGSLTAVEKNENTGLPERFHVDIANVNFMGRPPVPPKTPETPGMLTAYLRFLPYFNGLLRFGYPGKTRLQIQLQRRS